MTSYWKNKPSWCIWYIPTPSNPEALWQSSCQEIVVHLLWSLDGVPAWYLCNTYMNKFLTSVNDYPLTKSPFTTLGPLIANPLTFYFPFTLSTFNMTNDTWLIPKRHSPGGVPIPQHWYGKWRNYVLARVMQSIRSIVNILQKCSQGKNCDHSFLICAKTDQHQGSRKKHHSKTFPPWIPPKWRQYGVAFSQDLQRKNYKRLKYAFLMANIK